MLKNYFKIAFRNLRKNPGFSFINIFGLAVGIACCLLIMIYVQYELSYDQFHKKADRVVRVSVVTPDQSYAVTPSMVGPSLQKQVPGIENWVRLYEPTAYSPAIIGHGDKKFQEERFMYADSSFFDIFTFKFLAGNPETALSKPRSLVLPRSTAKKIFGSINAVGETINVRVFSRQYDFEVTGVVEDVPPNSHFHFDYLGSLHTMEGWPVLTDTEVRGANFYTYLLLSNAGAKSSVETTINTFVENQLPTERISGLALTPLSDLYLNSNFDFEIEPLGSMQNVLGFIFLAFMVLLIATINYINLATARSARRGMEVGIRKALGAGRSQLIKQFYGESILLTLISVGIALMLVEFFKQPFFKLMGQPIEYSLFSDPLTLILLVGIIIITAGLAGSYPAFLLSSYKPIRVLKGLFAGKGSDGKHRKGLVVFQFAISTFLILSTIVIYSQTNFMLTKDLGFDKEQIVVLPARDNELAPKQDLLKAEVLRRPEVNSATYMSNIPGKVFGGYGSRHTPNSEIVSTAAGAADADLVKSLGMELLAGQGFPENPGYSKEQGYVYILNQTLASAHGWSPQDAVGKRFNVLGNREGKVVGVVKDFNYASLREEVEPLALFINDDMYNYLLVKLEAGNVQKGLAALESVWNNVAPHRPFEFEFLDQQLNELYQAEIQTRNLLFLFSGLAIFIACLGLVGLSSFLIERRSKEIGIRKVLGASVSRIVTLLSSNFLKLVILGFIIGTPVAWYTTTQWLENFPYKIEIGPGLFLLAGGIAIMIALVTVSWQSIRAALANPIDSLRSE